MPVLEYDKRKVRWLVSGDGPGLLFMHGAGGNAAVWWQQTEYFSSSFKTVAYDLAGFGASTPPTVEGYVAQLAGTAAAVMDAAGLSKASVVCQSLGGWSGLRLALEYPERVERLILSCTMAGISHPAALQAFGDSTRLMDERGPVSLALAQDFEVRRPAKAYLYDQLSAGNPRIPDELRNLPFARQTLVPVARLRDIRCPVLLIAGEFDRIWPPQSLAGIVHAIPDARMVTIRGCGHSPYFERPEEFNHAVNEFLER